MNFSHSCADGMVTSEIAVGETSWQRANEGGGDEFANKERYKPPLG
jgi:hypothetical protein